MTEVYGYVEFPERPGLQGLQDKLAWMSAKAWKHAMGDQLFRDHVLSVVRTAGNAADAQFRAWEDYCKNLPYRREPGEIVRSPDRVAWSGGDCDCIAVYCCAGLRALSIPALLQILADEAGEGFHIRVIVGFPPLQPELWVICDPVIESEAEWAMVGRTELQAAMDGSSTWILLTEGDHEVQHVSWPDILKGALGLLAIQQLWKWLSREN